MSVLQAKHLSYKKGAKHVLKDINLILEQGDRCVLFGLNGCGKTTLLSILAGYHSGTDGELRLFDEEPTEENIYSLRQRIGWVSTSFFDQYYGYENNLDIVLAGKYGDLGLCDEVTDEDVRQAKHLMTALGLKRQMRYTYDMLSRGQRQKVLLARACMSECELLLLDEPCSGLDILSKAKVLYQLENMLKDQKKSVIYVAHHTDEILPFFNKAVLLKNGQIHSQGSLKKVFSTDNLTNFFQLPAKTVFVGDAIKIQLSAADIDLSKY